MLPTWRRSDQGNSISTPHPLLLTDGSFSAPSTQTARLTGSHPVGPSLMVGSEGAIDSNDIRGGPPSLGQWKM
jgi:hypothetical protein